MAENEIQAEELTEAPQGEPEKHETDWKAEARKWESRAKKSQAAEAELAELKAAQMTAQEKATARAEKAEAELAELKAMKARHDAAKAISSEAGVPLALLEYCADEDAMRSFVEAYKAAQPEPLHVPSAAPAVMAKVDKSEGGVVPTREQFAQFAAEKFKR